MKEFMNVSIVPRDRNIVEVSFVEAEPVFRPNSVSSEEICIWGLSDQLTNTIAQIVKVFTHVPLCQKIDHQDFMDLLKSQKNFTYDTSSNMVELRMCLCEDKQLQSVHTILPNNIYEGVYWYDDLVIATCVHKDFSPYDWQVLHEALVLKEVNRLVAITGVTPCIYVTCTFYNETIHQTMSSVKSATIDINYQHTFVTHGSAEKDAEMYKEWLRTVYGVSIENCNVFRLC